MSETEEPVLKLNSQLFEIDTAFIEAPFTGRPSKSSAELFMSIKDKP